MANDRLNSLKIGIGNSGLRNNDRIKTFKGSGWVLDKKWTFEKGIDASHAEKMVFKIVRKELKIPQHLSKALIGHGHGHTETMDADEVSLFELEKIIKRVIKGLRG